MLKVCHLITSLDVGGAEMSLQRLLSTIDTTRFSSSVIALIPPGRIGEILSQLGIHVQSLRLRRGSLAPAGLSRLMGRLRQERPDILMTWLYHADLMGLVAGKLAGVRTIVWNVRAADMDMSRYGRLSGLTLRLCTQLSHLPSAIVVNSQRGKDFHTRLGYQPARWALIRNGVDPELFKPDAAARAEVRRELGLLPDQVLIGLVARFDPMKDHQNFIAAARKVAEAEKAVQFVLIGRGVDARNRILAGDLAKAPLLGRVHLLGERDDIPRLTAALDVACSSSRSEGFPNTVIEAMACGITCVATDCGDASEILDATGIIVPPRNSDALQHGLLQAIKMGSANREAMGLAARERVQQRFSLKRFVQQYEELFRDLTTDRVR